MTFTDVRIVEQATCNREFLEELDYEQDGLVDSIVEYVQNGDSHENQ